MTLWMDPEALMLSEVSHTRKDKYHTISLICGIYREKKRKNWVPGYREQIAGSLRQQVWTWMKWVWGWGGSKGTSFQLQDEWRPGDVMYRMVALINNTVLHTWQLLRIGLKSFYDRRKEFCNHIWWRIITGLIVGIILQCIQILNYDIYTWN